MLDLDERVGSLETSEEALKKARHESSETPHKKYACVALED